MKRFLSLLLVLLLLFSLAVPAFASELVVTDDETLLSAPAVFAVADTTVPSVILSNIPPNTPIKYTVDGVDHSVYYTSVLKNDNGYNNGLFFYWFIDDVYVWGVFRGNCGINVSNFNSSASLVFSSGSYFFRYGWSYYIDGNFSSNLNSSDTNGKFVIPANAIFDGVTNPDLGGGDKTNGFIGEYGARILLPRNGFKQSKLNTVVTKIYYKIPYNGVMTDTKLNVAGYVGDRKDVTYHKVQELSNNTVLEGYLDVAGAVNWNKESSVAFSITDYTGKVYTCSVNVTCYDDFVDTDNDGLDDRTNQDEWTGNPDFNKPIYPDNSLPEGANVVDWFKWFFGQIGEFFNTLKSGFDSIISYGADFSKFLSSSFSYLPSEIPVFIGLGFTALVFLRIFGR